MEPEVWSSIKGYEGIYEVSNYGRVKSLERVIAYTLNGREVSRVQPTKILKPGKTGGTGGGKYQFVVLTNALREKKGWYVAHLVWDTFGQGQRNATDATVDHVDRDRENNNIENLRLLDRVGQVANREVSIKFRERVADSIKPTPKAPFVGPPKPGTLAFSAQELYLSHPTEGVVRFDETFTKSRGLKPSDVLRVLRGERKTVAGWRLVL